MKRPAQSIGVIFMAPAVIAALSLVGLAAALTGDGWRDMVSWAALAVPVGSVVWAHRTRKT